MNLVIALICLHAFVHFVSALAEGGNLAPCRTDSNCAGDRSCRVVELEVNNIDDYVLNATGIPIEIVLGGNSQTLAGVVDTLTAPCDNDEDYCLCIPLDLDLVTCSSSSDCLDGEQCVGDLPPFKICVADALVNKLPPRSCSADSECTDPDATCAKFLDTGFCLARFEEPAPSEEHEPSPFTTDEEGGDDDESDGGDGSEVCIAVKSLRHLQPHQLVYQKHMTARVLCDSYGSCATAGHMVQFRGRAMMMKSYCELVGNCERSITMVNSPRYTRALQIPSDSPDLTFTAFAARYATAVEEHVLRTAIHLRL